MIIRLLIVSGVVWLFTRALRAWLQTRYPRALTPILLVVSLLSSGFAFWQMNTYAFRTMAFLLVAMLYALLVWGGLALIYWLGRLVTRDWARALRRIAPMAWLGLIGLSLFNAYHTRIERLQITLDKPMPALRILMASDLHLGTLFGKQKLAELADIAQREKADIVLLPGDIMDDDTEAFDAEKMQPALRQLAQATPLGVFATLGNHDFFVDPNQIVQRLTESGVQVLYDNAVKINQQFWIVGRPDHLDHNRLATRALLDALPDKAPVILLDHRPDDIETHATLPIDLQLSGHVHNGQIFPLNLVVKMMNRLSYGYEKIGNGHFVVSSGYGFWGVPFRLGSQSEVWLIEVQGASTQQK